MSLRLHNLPLPQCTIFKEVIMSAWKLVHVGRFQYLCTANAGVSHKTFFLFITFNVVRLAF